MQLAAVLCLVSGGMVTRNISKVKNLDVDVAGIPLVVLEQEEPEPYVEV
jgi:hypothetical protein